MKVKKLGLSKKRGEIYGIHADGKVTTVVKGKTVRVARAKLVDPETFLYFIDGDGDLAREYRSRREASAARPSATKPASAGLETPELFDQIEELLFPRTTVNLATTGVLEARGSRAIYVREFKRLADRISRALGPPTTTDRSGNRAFAWELRGRWVELTLYSDPSTIDLGMRQPPVAK